MSVSTLKIQSIELKFFLAFIFCLFLTNLNIHFLRAPGEILSLYFIPFLLLLGFHRINLNILRNNRIFFFLTWIGWNILSASFSWWRFGFSLELLNDLAIFFFGILIFEYSRSFFKEKINVLFAPISLGLIFVSLYTLLEYIEPNQSVAKSICSVLSTPINCNFFTGRFSGLAEEPSHFAVYFFFAFPFLIPLTLNSRSRILSFFILTLVMFSALATKSRAIYVLLILNSIFVIFFYYRGKTKILIFVSSLILALGLTNLSIGSKGTKETKITVKDRENSNNTRYYTTLAGLKKGIDFLPLGSGPGTFSKDISKYLSTLAVDSDELERYKKLADKNLKIPSHNLVSKVFAETGFGVLVFGYGILYLLITIFKKQNKHSKDTCFILYALFFGLMLCFLIIDSYRYPTLWLAASYILASSEDTTPLKVET